MTGQSARGRARGREATFARVDLMILGVPWTHRTTVKRKPCQTLPRRFPRDKGQRSAADPNGAIR